MRSSRSDDLRESGHSAHALNQAEAASHSSPHPFVGLAVERPATRRRKKGIALRLEDPQQRSDGVRVELDVVVQKQDDWFLAALKHAVERRQAKIRLREKANGRKAICHQRSR